jgi:predicted RNA binding protein YcfA (HicA-like mRNA interferase family)
MPREERFAVIRRLLENNGWQLVRISGSHHIFRNAAGEIFVIPVHHGKVKPYYVRQAKKLIGED